MATTNASSFLLAFSGLFYVEQYFYPARYGCRLNSETPEE